MITAAILVVNAMERSKDLKGRQPDGLPGVSKDGAEGFLTRKYKDVDAR
jgi:hypothetical protein